MLLAARVRLVLLVVVEVDEDCSNLSYFSYRETETEAPSRDVDNLSLLDLLDDCCLPRLWLV